MGEKKLELGKVTSKIKPPTPHEFVFQVKPSNLELIKIGDYIYVEQNGKMIIGQIVSIKSEDPFSKDPLCMADSIDQDYDTLSEVPEEYNWIFAEVSVLGTLYDTGEVVFEGIPVTTHSKVFKLDDQNIKKILNLKDNGIFIGYLFNNPKINVILDPVTFIQEHSIIFGETRYGKSYTTGVLVEELHKQGLPVLIIDPHGEYYSFSQPNDEINEIENLPPDLSPQGFNTKVFSPPKFKEDTEELLTVNFSELEPSEIIEITRTSGENQIAVIYETSRRLQGQVYDVDDFIQMMRVVKNELKIQANIESVAARLDVLARGMGIFGQGFNPKLLVRKGQISVINLSGLDLDTQRVMITCILRRIFYEKQLGNLPNLAIVIDEVHRFAPNEGTAISKRIIEEIAKEGLKFGISLHTIAQRPTEVSPVLRSQAGTKIFHRLLDVSDLSYVNNLFGSIDPDLVKAIPKLRKGEAIIFSACTNYLPIRVKIRPRQSKHAGRTGTMRRKKLKLTDIVKTSNIHRHKKRTESSGITLDDYI